MEQIDNLISEQENMENYVEKVLKDFKVKTGEDAIELVGKADALDFIADVYACEHMCSNCCEGEGCNCDCGEYHIEVTNDVAEIPQFEGTLEALNNLTIIKK